MIVVECFNALTGLYLISTRRLLLSEVELRKDVPMPSRAYISFLHRSCILFLKGGLECVNALSGLYLISTVPLQKPRFYAVSRACFCRYLSEYSDNSHFSCILFCWGQALDACKRRIAWRLPWYAGLSNIKDAYLCFF